MLGQRSRPRADGALRAGAARRRRPTSASATRWRFVARGARVPPSGWSTMLVGRHGAVRRSRLLQARADRRRPTSRWPASRASGDLQRLTIFADNLVPHVLRCDGVLRYEGGPRCAHRRRAGCCAPGAEEREIRACAVHACELIAARAERVGTRARQLPCGAAGRRPSTRTDRGIAAGRSTTEAGYYLCPPPGPQTMRRGTCCGTSGGSGCSSSHRWAAAVASRAIVGMSAPGGGSSMTPMATS